MMKSHIAAALALGALTLSGAPAHAGESAPPSLEMYVVELAETPAQHTALAQYYHAKASEARAEQSRHEQLASAYRPGRMNEHQRMKDHCKAIAKEFAAMAKNFDEMASTHEQAAKAAKATK